MAGSLADVRPDERRVAGAAFLTLLGILAGHTILETARDALFLARLPASELPWVYLAIAGVAVGLSQLPGRGLGRLRGRRALPAALFLLAAITSAFWAFGTWEEAWMLRVLYVWTGLVGTLGSLQFWLVLGDILTITQAKRLYRLVGVGALLGGVAGAASARFIAARLSSHDLILASAIVLAATAAGPALLLRRPQRPDGGGPSGHWSIAEIRDLLASQPYVTRLAGLVLLSTVALTLGDYVFKSAVASVVPRDELGTFFASFYTVLNLLALTAQMWLMSFTLRTIGLHRSMWILPGLVAMGATGVAFGGGLIAALLMKGADGMLRPSLHRTGLELLYLPIPDGLRSRVKPVIDVLGQRGGQALASIFILGELSLHRGDTVLSLAAAVLCLVWIAWSSELRPHYVEMFRRALREGIIERTAELPDLDLGSLEALFLSLNSQNDGEVIAALDLLAEEGRIRLVPALILYHPSKKVVLRALEHLERSDRTDFVPVADRLRAHADEEIRAAALRARASVEPDEAVLRAARDDPSPLVQATGAVGLVAGGWISDEPQETLDRLLQAGSIEARRALARAIERQPAPAFETLLLELAAATLDTEVLVSAAHAMGRLRSESFLPSLLLMLDQHAVRDAARQALVAYGAPGLEFLGRCLADAGLPHEIRRHIPRTLIRFEGSGGDGPPRVAQLLLERLLAERDGMVRFKILRGLGRLASRHPDLLLDARLLHDATERTIEATLRLIHWRHVLEDGARQVPDRATRGHELLVTLLRDKQAHAIERLFRLLGLQYRGEDFERIYRGLRNRDPKVKASSRELIENLLRPPLREAMLALLDGTDADRADTGYYEPAALGYEELLAVLLETPGETLRSIAAYHAGELRLRGLVPQLRKLAGAETRIHVSRVLERTLAAMAVP